MVEEGLWEAEEVRCQGVWSKRLARRLLLQLSIRDEKLERQRLNAGYGIGVAAAL